MKIDLKVLVCPKCKHEYENRHLVSFYSKFAKAAKSFEENNVVVTKCENCKIDLVDEKYIEHFDENGNIKFKKWIIKFWEIELRSFIIYKLYNLKSLLSAFNVRKIILDGFVEILDKKEIENIDSNDEKNQDKSKVIFNHILFKFLIKNKEYIYFDFVINEVDYLYKNDTSVYGCFTYNSFYYNYFENYNKMIADTLKFSLKECLNINTDVQIRLNNLAKKYVED